MAEHGFRIYGVDKDKGRVEAYRSSRPPVCPPGDHEWLPPSTVHHDDFMNPMTGGTFGQTSPDNIIDNPPYNIAGDWIRHCGLILPEGGIHAHLLRFAFGASTTKRWDLFDPEQDGGPGLRFVGALRHRPSFCVSTHCKSCRGRWQFDAGSKMSDCLHPASDCLWSNDAPKADTMYRGSRTDSTDYAWYIWQVGYEGPAEFRALGGKR